MRSIALSSLVNTLSGGRIKYGWYDNDWRSDASPVFAGGCSRSGTTLLYSFMRSHSRFYIAFESALLTGTKRVDLVANSLGIPESELTPIYRRSRCTAEFTEQTLHMMMMRAGKYRWGDKTPSNIVQIEQIFRYFPNARFIHAIRDGRDVVCSMHTYQPTFLHRRPAHLTLNPWEWCIDEWANWVDKGLSFRDDPRYYELHYEHLVVAPEETLRRLYEWLGEPWEPAILNDARKTKINSHPGVSGQLYDSSQGRWNADLPAEARKMFYGRPAALLVKLGYAQDDAWITAS